MSDENPVNLGKAGGGEPPAPQVPPPPANPYGGSVYTPYGGYGYAPPPQHPQAMTVLVLGILAVTFCGICGPFAWVMGGRALQEIDAQPNRYSGRGMVLAGWILGIVETVLLIIALVVVLGLVVFGVIALSTTGS